MSRSKDNPDREVRESRRPDTVAQANAPEGIEMNTPAQDVRNKATIDAFAEEGAGIAAKE